MECIIKQRPSQKICTKNSVYFFFLPEGRSQFIRMPPPKNIIDSSSIITNKLIISAQVKYGSFKDFPFIFVYDLNQISIQELITFVRWSHQKTIVASYNDEVFSEYRNKTTEGIYPRLQKTFLISPI